MQSLLYIYLNKGTFDTKKKKNIEFVYFSVCTLKGNNFIMEKTWMRPNVDMCQYIFFKIQLNFL